MIITQCSRVVLSLRMQAACEINMVVQSPGERLAFSQLNAPNCTDESAITFGLILEYWIMMNAIDTVTNLDGLS